MEFSRTLVRLAASVAILHAYQRGLALLNLFVAWTRCFCASSRKIHSAYCQFNDNGDEVKKYQLDQDSNIRCAYRWKLSWEVVAWGASCLAHVSTWLDCFLYLAGKKFNCLRIPRHYCRYWSVYLSWSWPSLSAPVLRCNILEAAADLKERITGQQAALLSVTRWRLSIRKVGSRCRLNVVIFSDAWQRRFSVALRSFQYRIPLQ